MDTYTLIPTSNNLPNIEFEKKIINAKLPWDSSVKGNTESLIKHKITLIIADTKNTQHCLTKQGDFLIR